MMKRIIITIGMLALLTLGTGLALATPTMNTRIGDIKEVMPLDGETTLVMFEDGSVMQFVNVSGAMYQRLIEGKGQFGDSTILYEVGPGGENLVYMVTFNGLDLSPFIFLSGILAGIVISIIWWILFS
jgi:hypothetical protein